MALLFELVAEFGQDIEAAENFSKHFADLIFNLPEERQIKISSNLQNIWKDANGNYWIAVIPIGASIGQYSGIGQPFRLIKNEEELNSLGRYLYECLRTAPPYRFACVGYEVEEFCTFKELGEEGENALRPDGVVLSDNIYEYIGKPSQYIVFSEGYYWVPWEGTHF